MKKIILILQMFILLIFGGGQLYAKSLKSKKTFVCLDLNKYKSNDSTKTFSLEAATLDLEEDFSSDDDHCLHNGITFFKNHLIQKWFQSFSAIDIHFQYQLILDYKHNFKSKNCSIQLLNSVFII